MPDNSIELTSRVPVLVMGERIIQHMHDAPPRMTLLGTHRNLRSGWQVSTDDDRCGTSSCSQFTDDLLLNAVSSMFGKASGLSNRYSSLYLAGPR